MSETCRTCRFYYFDFGECRRYAPRAREHGDPLFPRTLDDGWCGEYQPTPATSAAPVDEPPS